jgi:hypothetical protein
MKPTILFDQQKQKNANVLRFLAKKLMSPNVGAGLGVAGGLDYLQNKDNYSEITPTRVGLGIVNALTGGLGTNMIRSGNIPGGITTVLAAPTKDVALAAIPAVHSVHKYNTEAAKTQEHLRKSFSGKLSPTEKTILAGAGLVGAAAVIPAIVNVSRAAKRVAEGRSVRVSTSLRKRPNQITDLNVGMVDIPEEELQEQQEEKPKGFLQKIMN